MTGEIAAKTSRHQSKPSSTGRSNQQKPIQRLPPIRPYERRKALVDTCFDRARTMIAEMANRLA